MAHAPEHLEAAASKAGWTLRGDVLAGDHLRVALPRADHGVNAGIGVNDHFEEGRAVEGEELGNGALQRVLAFRRCAQAKPSASAALMKSFLCRLLSVAQKRPLKNSFCHCRTMPSPLLFSTTTLIGRP